jgi:hypothetical protein
MDGYRVAAWQRRERTVTRRNDDLLAYDYSSFLRLKNQMGIKAEMMSRQMTAG